MLCAGCTAHVVPTVSPSKVTATSSEASSPAVAAARPASSPATSQEAAAAPALPESVTQVAEHNDAVAQAAADTASESEEEAAGEDEPGDSADDADEGEAGEAQASNGVVPTGPLYTADLSDEQLTQLWKKEPATLGSISVGFVESGRMVNSVRVPQGDDWIVVSPELAYGTQETVDYLLTAIREVRAAYPKAPPLRVNQLSSREGGYLRPHKSHQNGRDVDLGFYYPTVDPVRAREREKYIDLELNWALLKAIAMILLGAHIFGYFFTLTQVTQNLDLKTPPPVSAQKPPTGRSFVIFWPIVFTMRQPPNIVPMPMARKQLITTQVGR